MKVKVIRKRRPAPVATEQDSSAIDCIREIMNRYAVPQSVIVDAGIPRIPEGRFIEIIDALHYKAHHPIVANAKAKAYPNFTILEYADFFGI